MDSMIEQFLNPQILTMLFAAIAAGATVITLAMPLLAPDTLNKRMKAVALEREKIRQRERERMVAGANKASLRQSPRAFMKTVVENFNLNKWLGQDQAHTMLMQAGYRGQAPYVTYLFFRMVMPVVFFLTALFYIFVVLKLEQPATIKIGMAIDRESGSVTAIPASTNTATIAPSMKRSPWAKLMSWRTPYTMV